MDMSQALGAPRIEAPDLEEDRGWLAGRTVVHKIVIGLDDASVCLAAVAQEFAGVGGRIQAFTLNSMRSGAYEAVLQAADLSVGEAEGLVARLSARPGVGSVRVEHMLIR